MSQATARRSFGKWLMGTVLMPALVLIARRLLERYVRKRL